MRWYAAQLCVLSRTIVANATTRRILMPEWLMIVVFGATGGPGMISLVMHYLDRRGNRLDEAAQRETEEPQREWDLKRAVLETAEEMHAAMRAELARVVAELQTERTTFQAERDAMLKERAAWADERVALVAELMSERSQRRALEAEVDQLKERVAVLETRLRELGHDPEEIV